MVLEDEARPAQLRSCNPWGECKFSLQMRKGGLVRVYDSVLVRVLCTVLECVTMWLEDGNGICNVNVLNLVWSASVLLLLMESDLGLEDDRRMHSIVVLFDIASFAKIWFHLYKMIPIGMSS